MKSEKEIQVKRAGRKPTNEKAFNLIAAIKKGKFIIVLAKDWNLKTSPGRHIIRKHTGREFKVESLIDNSGWKCTALD